MLYPDPRNNETKTNLFAFFCSFPGVGASLYVTNYNVTIATDDISIGQEITRRIRSTTPGGLPGVKVMAFAHEGNVEIACNVEHISGDSNINESNSDNTTATQDIQQQPTYHNVCYTSPVAIETRVKTLAAEQGIALQGTSIIGFTPPEAYDLAVNSLRTGQTEFWRNRLPGAMM